MLHQQFRWNLHRIHLAVVLLDHPLKNHPRLESSASAVYPSLPTSFPARI